MRVRHLLVAWFTVLAFRSLGHHSGLTTHPDVIIDDSFTPSELRGVYGGMDSWSEHAPNVSFTPTLVTHAEAIRLALRNDTDNTIWVVRVTSAMDGDCPGSVDRSGLPFTNAIAGAWTRASNGSVVICMDAVYLNEHQGIWTADGWRSVMAHELGHAFGLQHNTTSSETVMYPKYGELQADDVTCDDVADFVRRWGYALPAECLR